MELLACGHVANVGRRLICGHLIGENTGHVDRVWLLRGIGLEYDICCAACGDASETPELIVACEGCVDNADSGAMKIRGTAQILYRPEAFDQTLRVSQMPVRADDVAAVDGREGEWILLSGDQVTRWNANTGLISAQWTVALPSLERAAPADKPARLRLLAAPNGDFAAIVADYHQCGVVIELRTGRQTMLLDRGSYHPEQTQFPAAFVGTGGKLLIAHATAWNRVDLSEPGTGIAITARDFDVAEGDRNPPHFLDYYYGALHPSPDNEWIVADGWVWHPIGSPRLWNLRDWRYQNVYESDDGDSALWLRYVDYHWDVPMCWLDNARLAIAGIGSDDLAMIQGVEIFGARTGELLTRFAGPHGTLLASDGILYSSSADGMCIWDTATGEQTGHLAGFMPSHQHRASRELVAINGTNLIRWKTL